MVSRGGGETPAAAAASSAAARPRRRPTAIPTRLFLFFLLGATAASAQQQQQQQQHSHDCNSGCPLSAELACADDGLVYAGECLAVCAGARVVPCGGGGGGGLGAAAAAAAAADSGNNDGSGPTLSSRMSVTATTTTSTSQASSDDAPSPAAPGFAAAMLDLSASSAFLRARGGGGGGGGAPVAAAASSPPSSSSSPQLGASAAAAASSNNAPAAPVAFTRADLERYADQGFALLGPARVASFRPRLARPRAAAAAASPSSSAQGGGGSSNSNSDSDVRAMRVTADSGLLYATRASVHSAAAGAAAGASSDDEGVAAMAALLASGGTPPQGWRPPAAAPRVGKLASAAASPSSLSLSAASTTAAGTGPNSTPTTTTTAAAPASSVGIGPGMDNAAWTEIRTASAAKTYPYSAMAHVILPDWTCSGARISKWTVLTAGHCVWDHESQSLQPLKGMSVRMARYRSSPKRAPVSPYKSAVVRSYTYFLDFAKTPVYTIGGSGMDVAVLELASDPGNTGTLGVGARPEQCGLALCDAGGPTASSSPPATTTTTTTTTTCPADSKCTTVLDSAAYPEETKQTGRMFRYRVQGAGRATLDDDAQDGVVNSTCYTPDSAAQPVLPRIEPGMSGSPLWTVGQPANGSTKPSYRIVGVLSGYETDVKKYPPVDGVSVCAGVFGYTEVTDKVFAMVSKAAADYDAAKGGVKGIKGV